MLIRDWEELSKIPNESDTHILEVDIEMCNGHLRAKNRLPYDDKKDYLEQVAHLDVYLSTHTFYGSQYKYSTKVLQACGFNVEIVSWDAEGGQ